MKFDSNKIQQTKKQEMESWFECQYYEIKELSINIRIRNNDLPFVVQQLVHK